MPDPTPKLTPGDRILCEIVKQGMIGLAYPPIPKGESAVFVWSANSVEQLDALFEELVKERSK